MTNVVRLVLRAFFERLAWYVFAMVWIGAWALFGYHVWDAVWTATTVGWQTGPGWWGQMVAGFVHAMALVGPLAGVLAGVWTLTYGIRFWRR